MATRDGAKALGWFDDIGSIEVGKKADLVALDLRTPSNCLPAHQQNNPEAIASSIVYSSDPRHVRMTWVNGRLLYANGKVTTIPVNTLMEQVVAAQLQIARKIKLTH
jgi:5-methylthioadenosine/S-adenosylhomocysteine deaminase